MTAMHSGELARARITNLEDGSAVTCMFNPEEYSFTRTAGWSLVERKGRDTPRLEFIGGDAAVLRLRLRFDTYEARDGSPAGRDVRVLTRRLWEMMKVSPIRRNPLTGLGRPPAVRFEWGSLWSFDAVITSIGETFTLFRPDGTPVRAVLDVELRQLRAEDEFPRQNPTSGGVAGEHVRTVVEGETLAGIAFAEYGDATAWRHLADVNRLADPRRLRPGQVLLITPLPPREGRAP